MAEEYRIAQIEKPDDAVWKAVGSGIRDYTLQQAGPSNGKQVCFVLYAPDQKIAGGVIGVTHWNWHYIDLLLIKEELRGHSYGHRLLTLAEEEARRCGATHTYLDTFSFQAPDFYQRHGYRVFGELRDFPPGYQRYYLTKEL